MKLEKEYYSAPEAGEILGIGSHAVFFRIEAGQIKNVIRFGKNNKRLAIPRDSLQAHIDNIKEIKSLMDKYNFGQMRQFQFRFLNKREMETGLAK